MFAREAMILLPEEFYLAHCGEVQTKVALNRVINKLRNMGIKIHTMNIFQNLNLIDNNYELFQIFNQCDHFVMTDQGYNITREVKTNTILDEIKKKSLKRYPYNPKVSHLEGMFYAAKKRCLKSATAFTKTYKCIVDFQSTKERLVTISEKTITDDCFYIKFNSASMQLSLVFGKQQLSSEIFNEKSSYPLRW